MTIDTPTDEIPSQNQTEQLLSEIEEAKITIQSLQSVEEIKGLYKIFQDKVRNILEPDESNLPALDKAIEELLIMCNTRITVLRTLETSL
ncbi:MAG: hypothetical protein WC304_00980 [Candidatus Gracilibacteria bacterium]|jgi:hypothetical protein